MGRRREERILLKSQWSDLLVGGNARLTYSHTEYNPLVCSLSNHVHAVRKITPSSQLQCPQQVVLQSHVYVLVTLSINLVIDHLERGGY